MSQAAAPVLPICRRSHTFACRCLFVLPALVLLGAISGCRANHHGDGKRDDMEVATPFGGISVKTSNADVQQAVGLTAYPGATLIQKSKGQNESADVNLNFGDFHLGVKALSYQTPDAPDKVKAFYRKDLARFGQVIECRGNQPVGTPARTPEGLTCDTDRHTEVHVNDDDDRDPANDQLRAGSRRNQHIVELEPDGTGTRIGLLALQLPDTPRLKHHGDEDAKQ